MKLNEIDKDEFVAKLDNSFEEKIKEAYLAGFFEGRQEGFNSSDRPSWVGDQTPEEAYEHWKKHGF